MMDNMKMISIYEEVADITHRMLQAARCADWDLLTQLETRCSSQVQELQQSESERQFSLVLTPEIRDKKVLIIKKILEDDKEIRNLTDPWMLQLANLIKSSESNRLLSHAYGANQHE